MRLLLMVPSPPPPPLCISITDAIGPRSKGGTSVTSVIEGDSRKLEQAVNKGEGRATLKMKRDGAAVVEEVVSVIVYLSLFICYFYFSFHLLLFISLQYLAMSLSIVVVVLMSP